MTYDPRNAFSEQQAAFGRASGVTSKIKTSTRPKARPGSLGAKREDKPKVTFKSAFEAAGGNTRKQEKQNVFPMKVYESPRFKIPERAYISTTTLDDAPESPDPILDMPNVRSFMAPRQSEPFKGYVAGEEPVRGRSPGKGLMSPPQPEAPNVPQYQDAIMRQLTRAQMETVPRPKIRPAMGVTSPTFINDFIKDLLPLEGARGDRQSSTKTFELGITEETAKQFGLNREDYTDGQEFVQDFTKLYVDKMYKENKKLFDKTDPKFHIPMMSLLWNTETFYGKQKAALNKGNMREYIKELSDTIVTEGYLSGGLSARRAKEANLIGENLEGWVPIEKVVVTGTRERPVFVWIDEEGNVVEQFDKGKSPLHPRSSLGEITL